MCVLAAAVFVVAPAASQTAAPSAASVTALEEVYADFNDAYGAVALIDSDPITYAQQSYADRSRAAWESQYVQERAQLFAALPEALKGAAGVEVRAVQVMQQALEDSTPTPESLAPTGHCQDAQHTELAQAPLQEALYACFAELANSLQFEGRRVTRVAAFDLLTRMPEPARRKALFMAFVPLWRALNGAGDAASPYRRMIRLAAAEARSKGSPIDAAARTVGVPVAETERWLVQILDTWRLVSGPERLEPWDYRYRQGAAERRLGTAIATADLQPLCQRYYQDLGLDLAQAGVIYDLAPRAGKAPLAYSDYVRRGRVRQGVWQPTIVRVSASYERGGLGPLQELVHENGHVLHMLALHTRPAFMDLGDPIFYEAFADVPSWSVYEPEWQQKYLGHALPESASLRALYGEVMLDVAWALFDLRMLRDADADPNQVWTDITSRYLHVRPHPELAWWAVRVQLVHKPGYMVNYGLGAVITADIRQRIAARLGPFTRGEPRLYAWLTEQLLGQGEERETAQQLVQFLGGPVSPQALLGELRRIEGHGRH